MIRSRAARRHLCASNLTVALSLALPASASAQGARVESKFGDWALHIAETETTKICFAAAEPKEKKPPNAVRATTAFYVSAWPKDGVKSEVSVKIGYKIKSGSKVAITIGKDTYKLAPNDERAFVSDATQELKLVEAMKKGSAMTVEAVPEKGPVTTDTYALAGFGQAFQAMAKVCQ